MGRFYILAAKIIFSEVIFTRYWKTVNYKPKITFKKAEIHDVVIQSSQYSVNKATQIEDTTFFGTYQCV